MSEKNDKTLTCGSATVNLDQANANDDTSEVIVQIQRFTASSISMLNLMQTACNKLNSENGEIGEKEKKAKDRFMDGSQKFIDLIKDTEEEFDYTRFIKKAFTTLRNEEQCKQLKEKDPNLFNVKDNENRIITILPGIDLKFGYKLLNDDEKKLFWQYMYLFSSSVFTMIRRSNTKKFAKYQHIVDTLQMMETDMAKTGVMFNNHIFNPFIGVGDNGQEFGVDKLFTGGELPKQQSVSIDSVLSMLGVDINKMFDEKKLNEELKGIGDKQINEATEKIVDLLGAGNKPEVKEVCNMLIQDIVANFKENGIGNIGETLRKVTENAKQNIEISKMRRTAESMKYFMANSQEKMKDLKDANGNPIGQQIMNSMAGPMSMMNFMKGGMGGKADQSVPSEQSAEDEGEDDGEDGGDENNGDKTIRVVGNGNGTDNPPKENVNKK